MPLATFTVVHNITRDNGGSATYTIPEAGNVTPTANALVLCFIFWGSSDNSTVSSVEQPTWASQAWTQGGISTGVGDRFSKVALYWTIATSSPSADNMLITMSTANNWQIGAGLWEIATGYHTTSPVRQTKLAEDGSTRVGSGTSPTPGNELTGTLDQTPNSGSLIILLGKAQQQNNYNFCDVISGFTKTGPATEEGGGQVSIIATAAGSNGTSFGGDFGDTGQDQVSGCVWMAAEIQEAGAQNSLSWIRA